MSDIEREKSIIQEFLTGRPIDKLKNDYIRYSDVDHTIRTKLSALQQENKEIKRIAFDGHALLLKKNKDLKKQLKTRSARHDHTTTEMLKETNAALDEIARLKEQTAKAREILINEDISIHKIRKLVKILQEPK